MNTNVMYERVYILQGIRKDTQFLVTFSTLPGGIPLKTRMLTIPNLRLTLGVVFAFFPVFCRAETPSTNATISFQFRAAQVEGTPLVQTPGAGRIVCRSTQGLTTGATYQATFVGGAGSGSISVAAEFSPYRCRTTFNLNVGAASLFTTESFGSEGTSEDVFIFVKNRRIRLQLQTSAGEPVLGIPAKVTLATAFREVNPYDPPARPFISDTKTVDVDNGRVQFSVVGDEVYRITVRPGAGSTGPGQSGTAGGGLRGAFTAPNSMRYFSEPSSFVIPFSNPSSDIPLDRPFLLEAANSNIEVTLYDTDNVTPLSGYLEITSRADSSDGSSFQLKALGRIEAGASLILPAVQGRTFRVEVGALPSEDTETFNPAPVVVTPLDEKGEIINISLTRPNYTLLVNPKLRDEDGTSLPLSSLSGITCFAFNARKERSISSDISAKGSIQLRLRNEKRSESEPFRVGCQATVESEDGAEDFFGLVKYSSKPNTRQDTIPVRMLRRGQSYPESSEEISVSQLQEVIFPDAETSLEVSPGAFGDSGTAELSLSSASGFKADIDSIPLQAWEITPRVNDTILTTPNNSVELCMPINAQQVAEFGVSEEAITLARYDTEEKRWISIPTTRVGDTSARFACGNLDHFSIFGTVLNVASILQDTVPQNLSVRLMSPSNQKTKQCKFTWDGPEANADLLTYVLQYRKKGNKKSCEEALAAELEQLVIAGKTRALIRTRSSCCGEVRLQESALASERKFKKSRKNG